MNDKIRWMAASNDWVLFMMGMKNGRCYYCNLPISMNLVPFLSYVANSHMKGYDLLKYTLYVKVGKNAK
jgi:hypothetical protein